MPLIQLLAPSVMTLGNAFATAEAAEDTDTCTGYCRVFSEMAESYVPLLVADCDINQGTMLSLVLRCMAYTDHEVADITINFWYRYTDALRALEPDAVRVARVNTHLPWLTQLASTCTMFPCVFCAH